MAFRQINLSTIFFACDGVQTLITGARYDLSSVHLIRLEGCVSSRLLNARTARVDQQFRYAMISVPLMITRINAKAHGSRDGLDVHASVAKASGQCRSTGRLAGPSSCLRAMQLMELRKHPSR